MNINSPEVPPSTPSLGVRILRFFVRATLILVLGIGLGVGLYLGLPALYRQFILPVQQHTLEISILSTQQAQNSQQNSQRIETLLERVDALELQSQDQLSSLEQAWVEMEAITQTQVAYLPTLAALQTASANQQVDFEQQRAALDDLQERLTRLESDSNAAIDQLDAALAGLEGRIQTLQTAQDQSVSQTALHNELQLLRAMNLLTRARYYLVANNTSLAEVDIRAAITIIQQLQHSLLADQTIYLAELEDYLNAALVNLPGQPVAADNQLQGAWELLLQGLPNLDSTPQPTPIGQTPTHTPTATATP